MDGSLADWLLHGWLDGWIAGSRMAGWIYGWITLRSQAGWIVLRWIGGWMDCSSMTGLTNACRALWFVTGSMTGCPGLTPGWLDSWLRAE